MTLSTTPETGAVTFQRFGRRIRAVLDSGASSALRLIEFVLRRMILEFRGPQIAIGDPLCEFGAFQRLHVDAPLPASVRVRSRSVLA